MKEIENNTNKWKDKPCSWIGRINIVKGGCTSQAIYRLNTNPYQIINGIFYRTGRKTFEMSRKYRRPHIAKTVLRQSTAGEITLPGFRI